MTHETKKRWTVRFKKMFHPKTAPSGEEAGISFSTLKKLAITDEQKNILKRIEQETIPSVRDAWIDYFLKHTGHSECREV
mgnify:CR=1 FL=1